MKEGIINLNNVLAYIVVIALVIVGAVTGLGAGGIWFVVGGLVGFVAGALISGVWFVLSGIYEQLIIANTHLKHLQPMRTSTDNAHTELEHIKKLIAGPTQ